MSVEMSVEMGSNPGNVLWPSESDFDCLMAEILTTSPIFAGESGSGVSGEDTQWPLWSGSGGNLGFDFEEIITNTPPIHNNEPRGVWCDVGGVNMQRPPQDSGSDNFTEFLANFSVSSAIFSGKPRGNKLPEHAEIVLTDSFRKKWFPSRQDKVFIANVANLTVDQVTSWFENSRKRLKVPPEQMLNVRKIDEGIFLENVYRAGDPSPYQLHRATEEPARSQQGIQLQQEQPQFNQGQDQPSDQLQAQAWPRPQPPPNQPWRSFPVGPRRGPKSRKIQLQKRSPDDLGFMYARKRWQEAFWMKEENKKVQELIGNKNSAIFVQSEQTRLAKVELAKANIELAKTKKMLAKSEERSKKVAQANAKMLEYISKKI